MRQEVVTDLLNILSVAQDPGIRLRLLRMIENNLRLGVASSERAKNLWPSLEDVKATVEGRPNIKPAAVKKQLKLFEQWDKVHERSLSLLSNSFGHIRVILDRLKPNDAPVKPLPASVEKANARHQGQTPA